MEPRIQYAKTTDGVSIAFYEMGEGPPVVLTSNVLWSHLRIQFVPEYHRSGRGLGRYHRLIRYDTRGAGLSDRNKLDFSLDARLCDLEAVVDHLELDRFVLLGGIHGGSAAIAYAAHRPERVSQLILLNSYVRGEDLRSHPRVRALESFREIAEEDWEGYTLAMASRQLGFSNADLARRLASAYRESMTPEGVRAFFNSLSEIDLTALLPQVEVPTLVLYRSDATFHPIEWSRQLASQIRGARFVATRGEPGIVWTDAEIHAVEEFLGVGDEAAAPAAPPSGLVTVIFTDVEGSTSLTQRLGDAGAREVLRAHERIVRQALKAHGGSEVKTMGDGFMASFGSATKALECAIAMQRAFAGHNESAQEPIRVRVGLNAGEPIAEDEDLFGTAVIVAARIAAKAEGGEILAANVVRELAAGKGFLFSDRGDVELRGFEDPVRLYEVRWQLAGGEHSWSAPDPSSAESTRKPKCS